VKPDSDGSRSECPPDVRVDVWLDVACLFKTRSEAQRACKGGKVDVNGQPAKPHRMIRVGDELVITRPFGRKQRVRVRDAVATHIPRTAARLLYEDLTPPLTAAEKEMRRLERIYRAASGPGRAPDKRARRELRRLKERG